MQTVGSSFPLRSFRNKHEKQSISICAWERHIGSNSLFWYPTTCRAIFPRLQFFEHGCKFTRIRSGYISSDLQYRSNNYRDRNNNCVGWISSCPPIPRYKSPFNMANLNCCSSEWIRQFMGWIFSNTRPKT